MFIKLKCGECENIDCPIDTKIWVDQEGCTREVEEDIAAKYEHYLQEVVPFWKMKSLAAIDKEYNEIINFLYDYIYHATIGNKIDKDGKIDVDKKWKEPIALFNLGVTPAPQLEDDSDFAQKLKMLF